MKNLENPITYLTNKDPEEPTIIAGLARRIKRTGNGHS